jgi:hypothetical protein
MTNIHAMGTAGPESYSRQPAKMKRSNAISETRPAIRWIACLRLFAAPALGSSSVLYINQPFELRDSDVPAKCVVDGKVRVAVDVGSRSSNSQVPRLRLQTGWNLCSLALTVTNAIAQLSNLVPQRSGASYGWTSGGTNHPVVAAGDALAAVMVLWLLATTDAAVTLRPSSPMQGIGTLPDFIGPGEVVFAQRDLPISLAQPDPRPRARFYQQDHLWCSSCLSDPVRNQVADAASYPFGCWRVRDFSPMGPKPYQSGQHERDAESSLDAYPIRYGESGLPRVLNPDPLYAVFGVFGSSLSDPQKLNVHACCLNNPIERVDPVGSHEEKLNMGNDAAQLRDPTMEMDLFPRDPNAPDLTLPQNAPNNVCLNQVLTIKLPELPPSGITIPEPEYDTQQQAADTLEGSNGQFPEFPKAASVSVLLNAVGKFKIKGKEPLTLSENGAKDIWQGSSGHHRAAVIALGGALVETAARAQQRSDAWATALDKLFGLSFDNSLPLPVRGVAELKVGVQLSNTEPTAAISAQ